ncbi:hypothetical protein TcWFU_005636 [Taenia crassiceps]|uniref:Uncharacterized protein n=1 Tax=Taenia crassiceps TaxID=6207 RepID=A0ABR4Q9L5_9CEST
MELLFLIAVSVATTAAYPMHSYHIFMGCYNSICSMNGIYGFHCKNGICSYICSEVGCRHDGLVSRPIVDKSTFIFYGCKEVSCAVQGVYGYGCVGGICHYICSDNGCVDVKWVRRTARCPPKVERKKSEKKSKAANKTPKEADTVGKENVDDKKVDLEEQSSSETSNNATKVVITAVSNVRKEEEEERTAEEEQLESLSPTKKPMEEPVALTEASSEPDVPNDATSVVDFVESSVKGSEVDNVISANEKKAVAPSEQDGKRKSTRRTPRKKLSRGPTRNRGQGGREQMDVNGP